MSYIVQPPKSGYIARNKQRVNSYKLTNEGYALLNLVERVKGAGAASQSNNKSASEKGEEEEQPQRQRSSSNAKDNTIKANESVRISKN